MAFDIVSPLWSYLSYTPYGNWAVVMMYNDYRKSEKVGVYAINISAVQTGSQSFKQSITPITGNQTFCNYFMIFTVHLLNCYKIF